MAGVPTASGTAPHAGAKRGLTVSPKVMTAGLITIAAVWFIIVNRARVGIYLWVPKVTAPMWLVLVITFAGGLITGLLLRRGKKQAQQ
jgi:putative exporter of polyketide antibiotics